MVFAVWAAQRDCDPDALGRIDRALRGAVAEASEHADLVAQAAGERHGFPAGYLARYFEKLRYGFGERERAGLERFYALAAERGAIAGAPELRFADPLAYADARGNRHRRQPRTGDPRESTRGNAALRRRRGDAAALA